LAVQYEWRNNSALFVHNLASAPREISLTVTAAKENGRLLINLLSEDHSHADAQGKHRLVLEGYGYRWYRIGGLDYLLKRSDIEDPSPRKK
jgi:maltose alpha-D-glucosyltransferase/alpha-amylase